jgi:Fe-S cluster assembly protein SufD
MSAPKRPDRRLLEIGSTMNAEIKPIRTAAETALAEAFAVADAVLPDADTTRQARRHAFEAIARDGFPHRRVEAWKYTDLRANLRFIAPAATAPDAETIAAAGDLIPFADLDADRVVLVNGYVVPALSILTEGQGVTITRLAEALHDGHLKLGGFEEGDFIQALNTAFVTDGVMVRIEPGAILTRPLHIASVHVGPGALSHVRVLVSAGEDSEATIVETHSSDNSAHQTTAVVEVDVRARAKLQHVRVQDLSLESVSLASVEAMLGEACQYDPLSVQVGSVLSRQEFAISFLGQKSTLGMRGISLAGGRRHLDTTLVAEHEAYGCESRELFKTVLDGEARAVFQGKIIVQPEAQKTDGKMMAQALMLAEGPEADMKPELEIYADDVVCGHGATAGQIDEDLLFYLRSRGIDAATAEALMVQAFLGEVIEAVENETLREKLTERALTWMQDRR